MRSLKKLWLDETGAMADRLPFLVAGALLVLVITGAVDETIRISGLAWAEQIVHGMGF